jgi:hypothetical protein
MAPAFESDPIFVHASPRSGSTYFFNVLRRNETLLCFNEAIIDGKHDLARFRRARRRSIGRFQVAEKWNVNHHFLDREDFDEFIQAWDAAMHLCPKFPTFVDYLPPNASISDELSTYLSALINYARSQRKRPVFCEINSRGRTGALRAEFGGFHIAQYRNPLSQFGSFIRAVVEAGFWGFLAFPATELGTSGNHPLYGLIPEHWRAPSLPWHAAGRAQHWASDAQYFAAVGSARPEDLERVFRWHMFSWFLTNLAALSYADCALDIDKVYDNSDYRTSVVSTLASRLNVTVDFNDLRKFDRYYEFESFDATNVCNQVASTIAAISKHGQLSDAIGRLGKEVPIIPLGRAVDLLIEKMWDSLTCMAASRERLHISSEQWKNIAKKNRKIWFDHRIRWLAKQLYPGVAPVVWGGRRVGAWYRSRTRRTRSSKA